MTDRLRALVKKLSGLRFVLLVAAAGLVLLLWPGGTKNAGSADEEARVAALLSRVEGVGEAHVLLSEAGAAVVCRGAADASVRLAVKEAVRSYTGLMSSDITVFQLE